MACQYSDCKTPADLLNNCVVCHTTSCDTCMRNHCMGCILDHPESEHKCENCKEVTCCSVLNRCGCRAILCDKCVCRVECNFCDSSDKLCIQCVKFGYWMFCKQCKLTRCDECQNKCECCEQTYCSSCSSSCHETCQDSQNKYKAQCYRERCADKGIYLPSNSRF